MIQKSALSSGLVYYSSKFLQPSTSFNQSWEGDGLHKFLGASDPVYYIYARKDTKDASFQEIDVFMLKLLPKSIGETEVTADGGAVLLVTKDGNLEDTGTKWETYEHTDNKIRVKVNVGKNVAPKIGRGTPTAKLRVPTLTKGAVESTAAFLKDKVEKDTQGS